MRRNPGLRRAIFHNAEELENIMAADKAEEAAATRDSRTAKNAS